MYWHHSRRTHQTILPTMTQGQPFSEQRRQSQVSIIITLSLRCTPRFATILIGSSSLAIISAVQNNDADFCFSNPIQNRLVSLRRGEETIFGQSGHYIISIWHLRLCIGVGVGKKRDWREIIWGCGHLLHNVIMTSCWGFSAYFASPLINSSVTWPSFLCLFIGSLNLSILRFPWVIGGGQL